MKTIKILLVDDELDQCELHQATLERAGYAVTSCTSPLQALTMIDDVDVVVTDLQMEELDGLLLCERVHEAAPALMASSAASQMRGMSMMSTVMPAATLL
jgi:CheY-like chemotaxis protein